MQHLCRIVFHISRIKPVNNEYEFFKMYDRSYIKVRSFVMLFAS